MPKNTFFFILIIISSISTSTYCQTSENGFYLTLPITKECSNLVYTLDKRKKYCASPRPILNTTEFESISEIIIDSARNQKTIVLNLTDQGFVIWKAVLKKFPNAELVLVIEKEAVGAVNNNGELVYKFIPVTGTLNAPEIDWIYNHLKKTIDSTQKE